MNNKEWLKKESLKWVQDELITAKQQEDIIMRYPTNKLYNPVLIFFAIVGTLLIGSGIILIFATNWWQISIVSKIYISFVPLIIAQILCLYTFFKKFDSTAFKESSNLFLSLSFFSTLALIDQTFHTYRPLHVYILICILFSLPGIYFFAGKASFLIYIIGTIFVSWSWSIWVTLGLILLISPFLYLELIRPLHREILNYYLYTISILIINAAMVSMRDYFEGFEIAILCSFLILILDNLYRKIIKVYSSNIIKLFSIFFITIVLLILSSNFSLSIDVHFRSYIISIIMSIIYFLLRSKQFKGIISTDIFYISLMILLFFSSYSGIISNIILAFISFYYIFKGSKNNDLKKLNFGMNLIILIIAIRFFDFDLGLLARGITFVIFGIIFICINLYITHKRKGL